MSAASRFSTIILCALLFAAAANAAEDPCAPARLGELVLGLFPPASLRVRVESAKLLGACKRPAVVGVLTDRLAHEPEDSVRIEVIRSLKRIGTQDALDALDRAKLQSPVLRAELERSAEPDPPPRKDPEIRTAEAPPQKLTEDDEGEDEYALPFDLKKTPEKAPEKEKRPALTPEGGEAKVTPPAVVIVPPPEPEIPFGERDGLPLAIATSSVAGATLFPYLAALAEQKSPLTLTLTGTAGAVIGGGSTWGLSRFGLRPRLGQAMWFTNVTAWGALSGLSLHSGLVAEAAIDTASKEKALWGLLAGGQTLGLAAGAWSARAWDWRPGHLVIANGLVLATWMTYGGARLLDGKSLAMNAPIAIATIPVMAGSAVASRYVNPSREDGHLVAAATLAGGWTGLLLGGATARPDTGGRLSGGAMLGLGSSFLTSAAASAFSEVDPRRTWGAVGFMAAGNAIGLGSMMVARPVNAADDYDTRPWAVGTAVGGLVLGTAAFASWPHLEFGDDAVSMAAAGAAYGSGVWLVSSLAGDNGIRHPADVPTIAGGMLAGGTALGTAGLLSSRWFQPTGWDHFVTASSTALVASAGLGGLRLLRPRPEQRGGADALAVIGGAGAGFALGAATQRYFPLRGEDAAAGAVGMAYGGLAGALLPTIGQEHWYRDGSGRDERVIGGGAMLGAGLGGVGAAAAAHALEASGGQIAVPAVAAGLGAGMGTGAGLLMNSVSTRGARIGAVGGMTLLAAASIAADRKLELSKGLTASARTMVPLSSALGAGYGAMLAELPTRRTGTRYFGGALFGASTGAAAGLVASRYVDLPPGGGLTLASYTVFGGLFGRGVAMMSTRPLTQDAQRRTDAIATLAGAALGTAGAALQMDAAPLEGTDAFAAAIGGGYGAVLGALLPSLGAAPWPGLDRVRGGGLLAGMSAGAVGAAVLRRASGVSSGTVGLTALGGLDGMGMGLGMGLLLSPDDNQTQQAERIGTTVGTVGGLALGALAWPRIELTPGRKKLIRTATLVSAWSGLWLPAVSYQDLGAGLREGPTARRMIGGVLAGAGAGSFASSLAASSFEVNEDALDDASVGYIIWGGAGAGAGAFFSRTDNAPVIAMLTAGTAGMVASGLLHERMDLGKNAPLSAALGTQLGWLGLWGSTLASRGPGPFDGYTGRQFLGGTSAGVLTGIGAAALIGDAVPLSAKQAGMSVVGSAVLSSVGGGVALLAPGLRNKGGVGLLMGLSSAGFVGGALAADQLDLRQDAMAASAAGLVIGAAQGLTFAWAAEASEPRDYFGATLIGAGVGTALGLSAAASGEGSGSAAPAAAGFAAWGAWVGSFSASLAYKDGAPDPRRVTMGGLIGANAGFAAGYALLKTELVQPRDIGWISAFGGAGLLLGAGVGATVSSRENPAPILAGLAVGPVVGMAAGAIIWPRVRGAMGSETPEPSAALDARHDLTAGRGLHSALRIVDWQPLMGAMPSANGSDGAAMVIGAQGILW